MLQMYNFYILSAAAYTKKKLRKGLRSFSTLDII